MPAVGPGLSPVGASGDEEERAPHPQLWALGSETLWHGGLPGSPPSPVSPSGLSRPDARSCLSSPCRTPELARG